MARTPDGNQPRSTFIHVRLTETGRRMVDAARGNVPVSTYIRRLIAADCETRNVTLEEKP